MDPRPGDTLACDEARAADPPHEPVNGQHVRFRAVVDERDGDYVAATVTTGNRHHATPDFGAELALSVATLREQPRWRLRD